MEGVAGAGWRLLCISPRLGGTGGASGLCLLQGRGRGLVWAPMATAPPHDCSARRLQHVQLLVQLSRGTAVRCQLPQCLPGRARGSWRRWRCLQLGTPMLAHGCPRDPGRGAEAWRLAPQVVPPRQAEGAELTGAAVCQWGQGAGEASAWSSRMGVLVVSWAWGAEPQ